MHFIILYNRRGKCTNEMTALVTVASMGINQTVITNGQLEPCVYGHWTPFYPYNWCCHILSQKLTVTKMLVVLYYICKHAHKKSLN